MKIVNIGEIPGKECEVLGIPALSKGFDTMQT